MRSVKAKAAQHHDPAPSRWAYRYQRMMLTPFFRLGVRVLLPFGLALGAGALWLSDQERMDQIMLSMSDMRRQIETRPEFMVNLMAIDGASEAVAEDIREITPFDFPISSFDLDPEDIREQLLGLSPIADASVHVRAGVLQITVTERVPVALWRTPQGLMTVDADGHVVGRAVWRTDHPDLPIMAGEGADQNVREALAILAAVEPLNDRLRGLVRMGARRWDVVLDRDQRILLPEEGAVEALERVIALGQTNDMFARDLMTVDMRLSHRPTLRVAERSVQDMWKIRKISMGLGQEQ